MSTQLGSMSVGSTVKLNLGGTPKDFLVVHQGLPSSMYDSSCNGTWLLLKDIYSNRTWDSSNNDYKNSDIHSYLNSTFLNLFDDDIKNAIKQVKIPYQNGTGSGGSVASGSNGLSCKKSSCCPVTRWASAPVIARTSPVTAQSSRTSALVHPVPLITSASLN